MTVDPIAVEGLTVYQVLDRITEGRVADPGGWEDERLMAGTLSEPFESGARDERGHPIIVQKIPAGAHLFGVLVV